MLSDRADLHLHSTYSDGVQKPVEVIRSAEKIGLAAIALTDHDTIDGLREFMSIRVRGDLRRVPGVEISTEIDGREAHILGYFVPEKSQRLAKRLKELAEAREERIPKIINKLQNLGFDIAQEEMQDALGSASSPGRPHIARHLLEKGLVDSVEEAFHKLLGVGRPAYVKKDRMDTRETISLLRKVGAVPVLAHPLTVPNISLKDLFRELSAIGLEGIETHYNYSHLEIERTNQDVEDAAAEFDFIFTGGSDSHGETSHGRMANVTVHVSVVDELYQAMKRIREERRSNR